MLTFNSKNARPIGEVLKGLREQKGLTRTGIERTLGVHHELVKLAETFFELRKGALNYLVNYITALGFDSYLVLVPNEQSMGQIKAVVADPNDELLEAAEAGLAWIKEQLPYDQAFTYEQTVEKLERAIAKEKGQ